MSRFIDSVFKEFSNTEQNDQTTERNHEINFLSGNSQRYTKQGHHLVQDRFQITNPLADNTRPRLLPKSFCIIYKSCGEQCAMNNMHIWCGKDSYKKYKNLMNSKLPNS